MGEDWSRGSGDTILAQVAHNLIFWDFLSGHNFQPCRTTRPYDGLCQYGTN
jgi:hypothetical protein